MSVRRTASWVLAAAVGVVVGAVLQRQGAEGRRLAALREAQLTHLPEASGPRLFPPTEPRPDPSLAKLRAAIDRAKLRLNAARRKAGDGAEIAPVWPDGAAVLPADEWSYRGTDSPEDTIESVLWAARAGDVDRLAGALGFEGDVGARAEEWFRKLSPDLQRQFGSAPQAVATLIAGTMPADYQAVAMTRPDENAVAPVALVTVRVQQKNGDQSDLVFRTERVAEGWRLDVPGAVLDRLQKRLASP